MGKRNDKEIERLLSRPKDYSFRELAKLLKRLGYEERNQGKTSGSRVCFFNPKTEGKIMIHKPHPGPVMKRYMIDEVIKNLKEKGEI